MSTKSEAQDIQFQGLRPKIPWYIAMGNALWRNPNMLIGLIFTSLVAIIALLAHLLIRFCILEDTFIFDTLNPILSMLCLCGSIYSYTSSLPFCP